MVQINVTQMRRALDNALKDGNLIKFGLKLIDNHDFTINKIPVIADDGNIKLYFIMETFFSSTGWWLWKKTDSCIVMMIVDAAEYKKSSYRPYKLNDMVDLPRGTVNFTVLNVKDGQMFARMIGAKLEEVKVTRYSRELNKIMNNKD